MIKLETESGRIRISDEVFTNLAGDAATSCFGVKGMISCQKEGGPLQLLRRESMSKGVKVHNSDEGTITLELHIGVDQGVNIAAVCTSIMNEVSYKLNAQTGIPISSVNVYVDAIMG